MGRRPLRWLGPFRVTRKERKSQGRPCPPGQKDQGRDQNLGPFPSAAPVLPPVWKEEASGAEPSLHPEPARVSAPQLKMLSAALSHAASVQELFLRKAAGEALRLT